jgi:isopenicillin-N epimerase
MQTRHRRNRATPDFDAHGVLSTGVNERQNQAFAANRAARVGFGFRPSFIALPWRAHHKWDPMIRSTRRGLLGMTAAIATAGAGSAFGDPAALPFTFDPDAKGDDDAYWAKVATLYDKPEGGIIQLENGQFGAMSIPVRLAYEAKTRLVNRQTTIYTRGPVFAEDWAKVRAKAAGMLGVGVDEIVFSRGTTESLQTLIGGYNRLRPGDAVLYADLDYDSMQTSMQGLGRLRGVRVVKINLPEPVSRQGLIDAYNAALKANPDIKLVLLTHLSHRTGVIPPIREIAALARGRGIDVILDGGHALGQTEFRLKDLGVDFCGLNLHKWIGSPIGVGVVYIRKDRIKDIDISLSAVPSDDIDARLHTGTVNNAAVLAVADAIDFQQALGLGAKARRLRHLRDLWAETLRGHPKVDVLTPDDPAMHAGLTSFRIKGIVSEADNVSLRRMLLDRYRILTVERAGPWKGACIRVTPSFINRPQDMQALVKAIEVIAA